ncbi:TniQ family protein [Actinomadura harenae]|uniref:TniQ domain-containing protein n=1 Tax=Actinomadura harenae TaxID=2483351 RepID=A0A3M2M790_9ACTN|nr:TniQ family protein [Actinomadura harenae]RMI45431.1 hypothetical protein EBO15_09405 [Actinomadura harenae]
MIEQPLRRLPITSPPAPYESLESYLSRLERINHLPLGALRRWTATSAKAKAKYNQFTSVTIDIAKVSILSGIPESTLRQAITGFMPDEDRRLLQPQQRPACPRCVHRAGGAVLCRHPFHYFTCLRHRTLVGGRAWGHPIEGPHSHLDLSLVPEVFSTQRRHRQLIRRYGHPTMADALVISEQWFEYFVQRHGMLNRSRTRITRLLGPKPGRLSIDSPAHVISYRPELVSLAGILAAPHWRAIAAAPETRARFYQEIDRITNLHGYEPITKQDPIHHWIQSLEPRRRSTLARFTEFDELFQNQ